MLGVRAGASATIVRRAADGASARADLPVPGAVAPVATPREGLAGDVTGLGVGAVLRPLGDGTMAATFAVAAARDRSAVLGVAATRDAGGTWSAALPVTPPCCNATALAPATDGRSVVAALADGGGARIVTAPVAALPAFGAPLSPATATAEIAGRRVAIAVTCAGPCSVTAGLPALPGTSRSVRLPAGAGTVTLRARPTPHLPPQAIPRRLRVRVAVCDDQGRVRRFSLRVARQP